MKSPLQALTRRSLLGSGLVATAALMTAGVSTLAHAIYPYYVDRGVARRTTRRTARRTTRRVVRRHYWGMPAGAVAFRWGGYRYFHAGGLYYYPYMFSGRTVYVQVTVDSGGHPLPPPPPSQVAVEINIQG